jgi:hypothetical protein
MASYRRKSVSISRRLLWVRFLVLDTGLRRYDAGVFGWVALKIRRDQQSALFARHAPEW